MTSAKRKSSMPMKPTALLAALTALALTGCATTTGSGPVAATPAPPPPAAKTAPAPAAPPMKELLTGDVLSHFRPVKTWHCVGHVAAVPGKEELTYGGQGKILVDVTAGKKRAPYLITKQKFKDVQVHVEFMVPKGSNSGIYLMGRYEVQILDSYGKAHPTYHDLGGIYQRWDKTRPKGHQGYEGFAPYANAAKPPGEWQTIDITFKAPRFNKAGQKIGDALFRKVVVNGVSVQENQLVTGPTEAHPLDGEAAEGPIAIQGDHGPVAIRSLKVRPLD